MVNDKLGPISKFSVGVMALTGTIYLFYSIVTTFIEPLYVNYALFFLLGISLSEIYQFINKFYQNWLKPIEAIILHSSLNLIQKEQIKEHINEVDKVRYFTFDLRKFSLYDRDLANWEDAKSFQLKKFQNTVKRIQFSSKIHYFGFPNIAMIIYLGYSFSLRYEIQLYQHIREPDHSYWGWKSNKKPRGWKVMVSDYEDLLITKNDEITVLISQSAQINRNDISDVLAINSVITIDATNPGLHNLESKVQAIEMVNQIKSILDIFKFCKLIHIFCAIPPPVAFLLGQNISNTMHSKIQLYEFTQSETPRYSKAIMIND